MCYSITCVNFRVIRFDSRCRKEDMYMATSILANVANDSDTLYIIFFGGCEMSLELEMVEMG